MPTNHILHKRRNLKWLPKRPIPSSPINTTALIICICFESKLTVRLRRGQSHRVIGSELQVHKQP